MKIIAENKLFHRVRVNKIAYYLKEGNNWNLSQEERESLVYIAILVYKNFIKDLVELSVEINKVNTKDHKLVQFHKISHVQEKIGLTLKTQSKIFINEVNKNGFLFVQYINELMDACKIHNPSYKAPEGINKDIEYILSKLDNLRKYNSYRGPQENIKTEAYVGEYSEKEGFRRLLNIYKILFRSYETDKNIWQGKIMFSEHILRSRNRFYTFTNLFENDFFISRRNLLNQSIFNTNNGYLAAPIDNVNTLFLLIMLYVDNNNDVTSDFLKVLNRATRFSYIKRDINFMHPKNINILENYLLEIGDFSYETIGENIDNALDFIQDEKPILKIV